MALPSLIPPPVTRATGRLSFLPMFLAHVPGDPTPATTPYDHVPIPPNREGLHGRGARARRRPLRRPDPAAAENFPISGRRFTRRFIEALGRLKEAAAETNAELGLVPERLADAFGAAAREVAEGRWDDHFPLDIYQTGSGTSTNMNANEVIAALANRAGGRRRAQPTPRTRPPPAPAPTPAPPPAHAHPNDHVNYGQSSNDIIPTAIHVSCRSAIRDELVPALTGLRDELDARARDFDGIVKSGRTHLMDATPVRLGQEFGGYARQGREGDRAAWSGRPRRWPRWRWGAPRPGPESTRTRVRVAHHGEGRGALRDRFPRSRGPLRGAGREGCLRVASRSAQHRGAGLMKIADDVRWLASGPTSGISEIRLPAVQPGSSIMPGKVNPVICEALMMVCASVAGNAVTVTVGGQRGNFELNVMMPVIADALLESITLLANGSAVFTERCVAGITARPERARELLERNPSIATALNAHIGYDRAAVVAKKAAGEGRSVRDVVEEMGLVAPEQLDDALDVRGMTEPGIPGKG